MNAQTLLARTACAGILATLAASPLSAGGPALLRAGVGLQYVSPTGDFSKECAAYGGATFLMELGLGDHQAIRGRLEWNLFDDKTEDEGSYGGGIIKSAVATVVMADYIIKFGSQEKGLYVFGGAGGVYGTTTTKGANSYSQPEVSESGFGLGYTAGIGYNFGRLFGDRSPEPTSLFRALCIESSLGLEVSYLTASKLVKPEGADKGLDFSWVQVSLRWRY